MARKKTATANRPATVADQADGPARIESAEERARREEQAEAKRRTNLGFVLAEAQRLDREADLYRHAHVRRWDHRPGRWTPQQLDEARTLLAGLGPRRPGGRRYRP